MDESLKISTCRRLFIYLFIYFPPTSRPISQSEIFISLFAEVFYSSLPLGAIQHRYCRGQLLVLCKHSPGELVTVQPANLKKEMNTVRPHKNNIYCVSLENEEIFISEEEGKIIATLRFKLIQVYDAKDPKWFQIAEDYLVICIYCFCRLLRKLIAIHPVVKLSSFSMTEDHNFIFR